MKPQRNEATNKLALVKAVGIQKSAVVDLANY